MEYIKCSYFSLKWVTYEAVRGLNKLNFQLFWKENLVRLKKKKVKLEVFAKYSFTKYISLKFGDGDQTSVE